MKIYLVGVLEDPVLFIYIYLYGVNIYYYLLHIEYAIYCRQIRP